ncbi:MAG: hypothetical protein ACODAJ_07190 [Planctomycetota bacterium]
MLLLDSEGRVATPEVELAAELGVPAEEVGRVVRALARSGIVERLADGARGVRLAMPLEDVTMSQLATASGDWLETASCDADPGPWAPGLSQALSVVRERVFVGLEHMRLV